MPSMKIGEETQAYAAADFTFPNNPRLIDLPIRPSRKMTEVPFSNFHIFTDSGALNPKIIVLNGTMFGSSKRTNFNDLAFHFADKNIKKFFISDTRFYYVVGVSELKETLTGERTNFIDYVGQFATPIPFIFSDTESTYAITTTSSSAMTLNDATAGSTGQFTNAGNAPGLIQKWTIANTGGVNITQVELGDLAISGGNVAGNRKLTWTGTLSSGSTLTIYLLKYATSSGGFKFTKYFYAEIGGSQSGNITFSSSLEGGPYISPETTDQSFSMKLTGNAGATVTAYFRDTYLS